MEFPDLWKHFLRSGKRYTGKAFCDRAAIQITCHDHCMLLRSTRYYILSASFDIYLWWLSHHFAMWLYLYRYTLLPVYSCFFSRSKRYTWLTAISNVGVSLHYLPKCLRSKVTCRTPIQWFQINLDLNTKSTHIRTVKTQKACVTNKNIWLCLFELKLYNRMLI